MDMLARAVLAGGTATLLTLESRFDGSDAPVLMNGKPSGESMGIKRVDDHHLGGRQDADRRQ